MRVDHTLHNVDDIEIFLIHNIPYLFCKKLNWIILGGPPKTSWRFGSVLKELLLIAVLQLVFFYLRLWYNSALLLLFGDQFFLCLVVALCTFSTAITDYFLSRTDTRRLLEKKVTLAHVKEIQPSVWIAFIILMNYYCIYQTFLNIGSNLLQQTGYRTSPNVSSRITAIPSFVQVFLRPYFGWFNDRHGNSLYLILISCSILFLSHVGVLGNILGMIWCSVSNSFLSFKMIEILILISMHFNEKRSKYNRYMVYKSNSSLFVCWSRLFSRTLNCFSTHSSYCTCKYSTNSFWNYVCIAGRFYLFCFLNAREKCV